MNLHVFGDATFGKPSQQNPARVFEAKDPDKPGPGEWTWPKMTGTDSGGQSAAASVGKTGPQGPAPKGSKNASDPAAAASGSAPEDASGAATTG